MKRSLAAAAWVLMSGAALAQPGGVQRLAWLQGCWAFASAERSVEEQWLAPRAGSMQGMSRTVRGDKLVAHEFVIVREQGEQLAYEVSPSGQATTVFVSTDIGPTSVVFENLQHDFPQRIGYERVAPDSVLAWIEGTKDGNPRRVEYPYHRERCGQHGAAR